MKRQVGPRAEIDEQEAGESPVLVGITSTAAPRFPGFLP